MLLSRLFLTNSPLTFLPPSPASILFKNKEEKRKKGLDFFLLLQYGKVLGVHVEIKTIIKFLHLLFFLV